MKNNLQVILTAALFLLLAATANFSAIAQENAEDELIYTVVEQLPQYPGGDAAMISFISQNIKYPEDARMLGIEGRVFVSFIIDKEGNLKDAKVEKGIGGGCDIEAWRVVKLLSGWAPAKQNGKTVNYRYILPIRFQLNNPEPQKKKGW